MNNEPRNINYIKLKEAFNTYLKSSNDVAEQKLKDKNFSGEELIYLLNDFKNKFSDLNDSRKFLLGEYVLLMNKLMDIVEEKEGNIIDDLHKIIKEYKPGIEKELDKLKDSQLQ